MTGPVGTPPVRTGDAPVGAARAEVLAAADACVRAFGAHDTAAYFACFDPTATFLFHTTDRLLGSRAEYEAEWASWEAEGFRVLSCTSSEQRVDLLDSGAGGAVGTGDPGAVGAIAVLTHRVRTEVRPATGAEPEVTRERETIVWRRGTDGWLAVHEHLSARPRRLTTSRAPPDTRGAFPGSVRGRPHPRRHGPPVCC
jgi:hypothetical protein